MAIFYPPSSIFDSYSVELLAILSGGVAERFKAPVLKTGVHFVDREFESRPLRQT